MLAENICVLFGTSFENIQYRRRPSILLLYLRFYASQAGPATRILPILPSLSLTVSSSTPRVLVFSPSNLHIRFFFALSSLPSYISHLDYFVIIDSPPHVSKPFQSILSRFSGITFDTPKLRIHFEFYLIQSLLTVNSRFWNFCYYLLFLN